MDEAHYYRMLNWHHSGLIGRVRMAQKVCTAVAACETVTDEAKILQDEIHRQLIQLEELLKIRKPITIEMVLNHIPASTYNKSNDDGGPVF